MDPALCLQPGQQALTPAQEAEVERFVQERIAAQLSTDPVDEPKAEALLQQAYAVAGLPPPQQIRWVDGPLEMAAVMVSYVSYRVQRFVRPNEWDRVRERVEASVEQSVGREVWEQVLEQVGDSVGEGVWDNVGQLMEYGMDASLRKRLRENWKASGWYRLPWNVEASVEALSRVGLF